MSSSARAPRPTREEGFYVLGEPAPAPVLPEPSAPDPVRLTALAAEHGIEILPPPPA